MTFHKQLKNYRDQLGLTQDQAASLLSISKRTYCDWEYGITTPAKVGQEGVIARLQKSCPPEGSVLAGILGDYADDVYGYVFDGYKWHGPSVWGGMENSSPDYCSYEWPFAKAEKEVAV